MSSRVQSRARGLFRDARELVRELHGVLTRGLGGTVPVALSMEIDGAARRGLVRRLRAVRARA